MEALSAVQGVDMGSDEAARCVAHALATIAEGHGTGKAACVAASAPAALVALAGQPAIKSSAAAAEQVARAFLNIASSAGPNRAACVAAGAAPALRGLAAGNTKGAEMIEKALKRLNE